MDSMGRLRGRDALEFNVDVPGEEETSHVLGEEVVGPWLSYGTDELVFAFQCSRGHTG